MKSIFASKTFWFNLISGALGSLQSLDLVHIIPAPFGPVIVGVGNIILRYITTQPVSITGAIPAPKE